MRRRHATHTAHLCCEDGVTVEDVPAAGRTSGVQRSAEVDPAAAALAGCAAGHPDRSGRDRRHRRRTAGRDHHGQAGDQHQRAHRAPGPQAGLCTRSRRPGRSGRNRVDVGDLRGRPDPRQGPPGAGRRPRSRHVARADDVQPGTACRRPVLGGHRQRQLGRRRADPAGCGWTACSTSPKRASAAKGRSWSRDTFDVVAARLRRDYSWS